MENAITFVTGGLTLVAFIVAAVLYGYRAQLEARQKTIESAPEADRVRAIEAAAESIHVDLSDLPKAERQRVVLEQLSLRSQRQFMLFILAIVVAVLLAIIALVAMFIKPASASPYAEDLAQLADYGPQTVGALERLGRAGTKADDYGICGAVVSYVKVQAPQAAAQVSATLREDVQTAVQTLSALRRAKGCTDINLETVSLKRLKLLNGSLEGFQLSSSKLDEAELTGSDLTNAQLTGAILTGVVFRNTKLKGAKFTSATVKGARFTGATDVCLKGALNTDAAIDVDAEALLC